MWPERKRKNTCAERRNPAKKTKTKACAEREIRSGRKGKDRGEKIKDMCEGKNLSRKKGKR